MLTSLLMVAALVSGQVDSTRTACVQANLTENAMTLTGMTEAQAVSDVSAQLRNAGWTVIPTDSSFSCKGERLVLVSASALAVRRVNSDSTGLDTLAFAFSVFVQDFDKFQLLRDSEHWWWAENWDWFGTWTVTDNVTQENGLYRLRLAFAKYIANLINHENGQDSLNN